MADSHQGSDGTSDVKVTGLLLDRLSPETARNPHPYYQRLRPLVFEAVRG